MSALDVLARLTPQMRAVLAKQNELAGDAYATDVGFEQMRLNYAAERVFWNEGGPVMARTADDVVPGPSRDVPIRIHYPAAVDAAAGGPDAAKPAALVYIHGGGFVVGNLDTHDRIMRSLADAAGVVVVGVDYALSPEAKYPQALHECAAVVAAVAANADEIGIDRSRIALAGDSGGAALCLGTALYLHDTGGPALCALLLYYGFYGLQDSASQRFFGGEWDGLRRADLDYYMNSYFAAAEDRAGRYANQLDTDLSGVPACYIVECALDPLADDSRALAAICAERGIPYRHRVFDGVLHAFLHHSRMLPEAAEALAEGAAFLRDAVATG